MFWCFTVSIHNLIQCWPLLLRNTGQIKADKFRPLKEDTRQIFLFQRNFWENRVSAKIYCIFPLTKHAINIIITDTITSSTTWKPLCKGNHRSPESSRHKDWLHYGDVEWPSGISTYRSIECLFNRLFRLITKEHKMSALLALCEGNPPVTGRFPSQRPVTQNMFPFDGVRWMRDFDDLFVVRPHGRRWPPP